MGLHGGQVEDVLADEGFGNLEAVGVYFVQSEHSVFWLEIDPLSVFEEESLQAVHLLDRGVLVVDRADFGVNYDGAVVGGDEIVVTVGFEGTDCAVELPGRSGAGGVVVLP